jgi:hypothetical protein
VHAADLITRLPTVEEVLDGDAAELGHDRIAYRNDVYRVANLCLASMGDRRVDRWLATLTIDRWRKHPLNRLPMVKW